MIFLSAQPDTCYFLWQIQMQLFNFSQLGISPEKIHVLIGYNPQKGLNAEFIDFINENKQATFYTYPDLRKSTKYSSSIRPHIIHQHYLSNPHLEKETIFYHDSDIVFRELPNFNQLNQDETWYVSDTRSYLNTQYIISTAGETVFYSMCKVVGIPPSLVKANDENAGGAQYLIKNCKSDFWKKLERDCEKLYNIMERHNGKQGFCEKNKTQQIQSWCADMWALWWNALLSGTTFKIDAELDFCWANNPIEYWYSTKILHYTGEVAKDNLTLFRKSNYSQYPPFYDRFTEINPKSCSHPLKDIIHAYVARRKHERIDLRDVSFLILVKIDSENRLENIKAVVHYLDHWFNTNILVLEAGETSQLGADSFPDEVQYFFVKDENPRFNRPKFNNQLIRKAKTPFISIYDADIIFPVQQLLQAVEVLRSGSHAIVSPYDGCFGGVDLLLKAMFLKLPDPAFFEANKKKISVGTKRSYGGAILLNREVYIRAGMENEHLFLWGPDDIERVKRMQILGYPTKRIPGHLYHLHHERGINSTYPSLEDRCLMMGEYINICSMRKTELETYIKTW